MKNSPPSLVTLLFTGGHVTPALATIEEVKRKHPLWRIVFVGRMHALERSSVLSEEYRMITELGIRFLPLLAGRWKREGGISAVISLLKVPVGFVQALGYIAKVRPAVVVSFGGYIALPVTIAARFFGVPIVTHEQTTRPGFSNQLIAKIATKVCVTFPETSRILGSAKGAEVTGLPIRKEVLASPARSPFDMPKDKPLLLIVGGSTGSQSINEVVFDALGTLLRTYAVIHQVGRTSEKRCAEITQRLPVSLQTSYVAKAYLSPSEYSWGIHHADIVIGRSGANTVMELAIAGAVTICIPLPWAAGNEQFFNAEYLVQGGGVILPQQRLNKETLVRTLREVWSDWEAKKVKAKRLSSEVPKDGAAKFVRVIEEVVELEADL